MVIYLFLFTHLSKYVQVIREKAFIKINNSGVPICQISILIDSDRLPCCQLLMSPGYSMFILSRNVSSLKDKVS